MQEIDSDYQKSKEGIEKQFIAFTMIVGEMYLGRVSSDALETTLHYFRRFIDTRTRRAERDLKSPEYQNALGIARSLLTDAYGSVCIDGRTPPIFLAGLIAKLGGWTRVPAGVLYGFEVSRKDGRLYLPRSTDIAKKIDRALTKVDVLTETLVAHLGCKAAERSDTLGLPDQGLMENVYKQKERAEALADYAADHHPGKALIPILFIYDPHGYGYMGMETLLPPDIRKGKELFPQGLTEAVLQEAIRRENGGILATGYLVERFPDAFAEAERGITGAALDWIDHYGRSAHEFWTAVDRLYHHIEGFLSEELGRIYPHLLHPSSSEQATLAKRELRIRSVFCIANALSGYLENFLTQHNETHIIIQNGSEYEPYRQESAFRVDGTNPREVPNELELADGMVMKRIRETRTDHPVPVIITEKIEEEISQSTWRILSEIDWSDLYRDNIDWLDHTAFDKYLIGKIPPGSIPDREREIVLDEMSSLPRIAASPYEAEGIKELVYRGRVIAMGTITDNEARPRVILPLLAKGSRKI